MTPMEFARAFMHPYQEKGNEIVPVHCPYCHGGEKGDKYTAAMNAQTGAFNCKRGSCGKEVSFYQLCKDFNVKSDSESAESTIGIYMPKKYTKPKTEVKPIATATEQYLALRKISKATMDFYGVGSDDKGNIIFPYRDETGDLTFVKFRPARKIQKGERKMWRESGTKPILFGMDLCDNQFPLTVFEGEIDAMSGKEANIPNCVSIPSGSEDFTWLDTCWDFVHSFKTVVLFGDNDEAGKKMIDVLKTRLADLEVKIVEHPYKDANELLFKDGVKPIIKCWSAAKAVPPFGLINLADVEPIDIKQIPKTLSGIYELDKAIGGFLDGELSVWTGKRGEGKSTILGQMLIESVEQGNPVCAYSGELRKDRFQYWINLQAAGKKNVLSYFDTKSEKDVCYVEKTALSRIRRWYDGKIWLYDNEIANANEMENVLKAFEIAAKRYGCKVFMVDNLMTLRYSTIKESDMFQLQTNIAAELSSFAKRYSAHIHLVAHPRKTQGELGNDDVSGSANITNLADNVFTVQRVDPNKAGCDVILSVKKNRSDGAQCKVGLNYEPTSRRLYMPSKGDIKKYSWEDL